MTAISAEQHRSGATQDVNGRTLRRGFDGPEYRQADPAAVTHRRAGKGLWADLYTDPGMVSLPRRISRSSRGRLTRTAASARIRLRHAVGRGLRDSPPAVQDAVRRASIRILAALGPVETPDGQPSRSDTGWQSPPVPVPEGTSVSELEQSLRTWSVNAEPPGHLVAYVDDSIWRFLHTWGVVRYDTGTCLELGANPYFTTYLLDQHTKLELTLANFYGTKGQTTETVSFVPPGGTNRLEVEKKSWMFNVEEDEFPFDSHAFDVVLFCEILEHLLMDPLKVLRQIHRVLKPGGTLVLTTPNVARLDNLLSMVNGANIYDPYSGFGPYGRHNREYTRHELHRLLEFAGFDVEYSFTADGHPTDPRRWPHFDVAAPLVDFRRDDLGHYLFVRARAARPPRDHVPSFLYRSRPDGEIVPYA
jgi:SAM-dependent methyltransferase